MAHVNHGRFIWHDLMTPDPAADLAFVKALVGWSVADRDMGAMGTYHMLMAGDDGVGGVVGMGPDEAGLPAHWIGYVVVTDLEATLAAARAAGGKVVVEAFDIADVGRTAVVVDPHGAAFSPLQPATADDMLPSSPMGQGRFCWWELVTPDPAGAEAFYGQVVGWSSHAIDMGGRPYWLWTNGDDPMNPGGLMAHPEGQAGPAYWLYYVLVADVDASTARVAGLGGRVLSEPMDVPGQGRMSVIALPSGAALALFTAAGG